MTSNAKCCRLDLSSMAKALQIISEPNRLKILCLLRQEECCVCQLEKALNLRHNLICHHLKALARLGMLRSKSRGNFTFYSLNKKAYQALLADVNKVLGGK
ncbi:MAG: metalloregulator ArsR/SmtB family transcription factor [Candidatus Margulisiibacteriota bacterium]